MCPKFPAGSHGDGGDEAAGDENDVEDGERHEGAVSCDESSEKFKETREEEDRTKKPMIYTGSSSVDGRLRCFEDGDNVSSDGGWKDEVCTNCNNGTVGSRVLGAEKTHGEKSMETGGFSITGFGSGALKRALDGGGDSSSPPVYFNIEEFLLLANRILDGDDKSKAALNDLKTRWEKKFRTICCK
ncbi:UNVERIFIED_CONTAM: hypothetical protein Sindi_2909300 [Sesamum indicum]